MTNAPPLDQGPDPAELATRLDAPGPVGSTGSLHPDAAACGHFGIRIARDGTWFYHGSPIGRKPLVQLFSKVLRREKDGSYWLVTPVERGVIDVDDAPFTAVELTVNGSGKNQRLVFRTNLDEMVVAGREHPIRVEEDAATREPSPYINVRSNLDALIVRPVFYQLVDIAEERVVDGARLLGVWSEGEFFSLGRLP